MNQFQKNALFINWLLNTLISSDYKPPLKDMTYLNFQELLLEKLCTFQWMLILTTNNEQNIIQSFIPLILDNDFSLSNNLQI